MAKRAYNFNAGPAALPIEVLQTAAEEMTDYKGTGMSVMEMSHRSKQFEDLNNETQSLFKELLGLPDGYKVLFLQGGASTQFAMIPMNLLGAGKSAGYVLTGAWATKAYKEAQLFGDTFAAGSSKESGYRRVPDISGFATPDNAAYLHVTSNETIEGVQFQRFPETGNVPLIADMSSDILSRPVDASKFALIYAGAQKNLGPSGVTVVIAREELVSESPKHLATMLRYDTHAQSNSLYNTPPSFSVYIMNLVLRWIRDNGGLAAMERKNIEKTDLIYKAIDDSAGLYVGHADKPFRSRMNITFRLNDEALEKTFLKEAEAAGFVGLKGHRSVGGCRASTYNAVPYESCKALAEFMTDFRLRHM
ncbi:3-phosphoserine/phosphohydroxythreonine transaminase [Paenibacillus thermotolerans]|uniref:3-phosphoserine/phosphohydroxythreonine transaminase n=1 Tax=Paenibacillus thermotolerans TaxID=3027807 RepID=UPI002367BE76|nr:MULTISPECIES: 3-phosphoserine/phosphohydroxythreonine transaminase [unclassified Paenibacillus]